MARFFSGTKAAVSEAHSHRWEEIRAVISGPIFLLAFVASMGGFIFGADTGQISGFLIMTVLLLVIFFRMTANWDQDFLRRFAQYRGGDTYLFSDVREGLVVGLLSIGALIGALAAAPFSDKIGRRKSMLVACAVFICGNQRASAISNDLISFRIIIYYSPHICSILARFALLRASICFRALSASPPKSMGAN